ncbi:hypothetical protein Agub_g302, partial [Astrephomene gubernaculifera]
LLFAAGLFFFAVLSLSIYVKDPDSVTLKSSVTAKEPVRRSLGTSAKDAKRIGSRQRPQIHSIPGTPLKLLLASHNRLFWYDVANDTVQVLHEGEGVHYGIFPGERSEDGRLKTVWNVIRPHNWHPKTSEEFLVQFDAETGSEVSRVRIHSRFTHDAVRRGDRVYLANTEGGEVQELRYPDMKKLRSMRLFSLKQHVNTLAPLETGAVWAVLHNLGKSDAVRIDLNADPVPRVSGKVRGVGSKAHGLVALSPVSAPASSDAASDAAASGSSGGATGRLLVLDSEAGGLVEVDAGSGEVHSRWQAPADESPSKFLKGLCVVDGVAYFGVNVWGSRESRDSTGNDAELAAVDLASGSLLWRRRVPSHGLLNIVAAPQLGEESTYMAMAAEGGVAAAAAATAGENKEGAGEHGHAKQEEQHRRQQGQQHHQEKKQATKHEAGSSSSSKSKSSSSSSHSHAHDRKAISTTTSAAGNSSISMTGLGGVATGINDPRVAAATQKLIDMGYPPVVSGYWSSGQPHLDLKTKDTAKCWEAGLSLPLMRLNIERLRERVINMPDDMWSPVRQRRENAAVDGRKDNMDKFKPGVEALFMVFSDQSTEHVYRFPYYEYFKDVVEPLVEQIIGPADMNKIVRLQFARMKPGIEIKMHKDMGGYARFAHRIHLPVVSNSNVSFQVCPNLERSYVEEGKAAARRNRRLGEQQQGLREDDCVAIPMEEGMVFELNNRVLHLVLNHSNLKRVQMVVDVAEEPRQPRRLKPGTVCRYESAVMVCPPEGILPDDV